MIKRLPFAFGALVFLIFTLLQFNDAGQYGNYDAWIWIAIYGAMTAISAMMIWRPIALHWLFAWAGFTWGALLFRLQDGQGNIHIEWLHPANYWDETNTMVQQSNESGGLLILAVWASCVAIITYFNQKKT